MRNKALAKLYDYLGFDLLESLSDDVTCGDLTENTGRDGDDYFWYFDGVMDVAIKIKSGEIITDEDEIDILFC